MAINSFIIGCWLLLVVHKVMSDKNDGNVVLCYVIIDILSVVFN